MACTESGAIVAVEVLVKQDEVAPIRVLLELSSSPVYRPATVLVPHKDASQPARDLLGHLVQRHSVPITRRTFDREVIAVIHVVLQQRPDDQRVHGHPVWPSPIRVAAEYA